MDTLSPVSSGEVPDEDQQPRTYPAGKPVLYTVANAHLDTQWNWTARETILIHIPKTLHGNFALFDRYPGYVFNFEGAFRYRLAREYYPDDYEKLKECIAQGRWHVAGSAWDAGDVNIPSPESLVRHFLYGNGFFKREFGKTSIDIMLPDCFGFGYALPSIAAHCGIKGFHSQKLSWGPAEPVPFRIGVWEGVDGRSVIAVLEPGNYAGKVREALESSDYWQKRIVERLEQSGSAREYMYYGVGDTGGCPDEESVAHIQASLQSDGPIRVISASADQIFRDMTEEEIARLPRFKGELLMRIHAIGCYTSQAAMKRWNRRNELLGDAAERAAVAASLLGASPYPADKLTEAWQNFLWHQFHDDLTGTSTPQVYQISWNDEAISENCFGEVLRTASSSVSRALDTRVKGIPLVVYNPLSAARAGIVEAGIEFPELAPDAVRVFDPEGCEVPSQLLNDSGSHATIAFVAELPSVAWKVYDVRCAARPSAMKTGLKVSKTKLENDYYCVKLDRRGDVASIFDKKLGRELLKSPMRLEFFKDESHAWPAWEIMYDDIAAGPVGYVSGPAEVRVVERGPARVALEVIRQSRDSLFVQKISLAAGEAGDHVRFELFIDWKTRKSLLKASFPLSCASPTATYDLGMGTIERGTNTPNKFEVPAQQWADITDQTGEYGAAILNDCKYGWDKPDANTLRLTLLHTPGCDKAFSYQSMQDIGRHKIMYAVTGHRGSWREGSIAWRAARLNQPLMALQVSPKRGSAGKVLSLLQIDNPALMVRALKKAEESANLIVRVQEQEGREHKSVVLGLAGGVTRASEVSGCEQNLGEATVKDGKLVFDIAPYEMRTFELEPAPWQIKLTPPESRPVSLSYDLPATSCDQQPNGIDIDGHGGSFPAELFPPVVVAEGIRFELGRATAGSLNALACRGQELTIDAPEQSAVYLLAAAVGGDTRGVFRVDGAPVQVSVQDYGQPVAQWELPLHNNKVTDRTDQILPALLKRDPIAWFCSHRHNTEGRNQPYAMCCLFKYKIPLPGGCRVIELPDNNRILLFAMTTVSEPDDSGVAAWPMDEELYGWPRITPNGSSFLDTTEIVIESDFRQAQIRYTLDGSEPDVKSPLYAGPFRIADSCTVAARVFVPGRELALTSSAHFRKMAPRQPENPSAVEPGLSYAYYEGRWDRVVDFGALPAQKTGVTERFGLGVRNRDENYALEFRGFIDVQVAGLYHFFTVSDDGSLLFIGDEKVVDNDGLHGATECQGSIALAPGRHAIRVSFFQASADQYLEVLYEGPELPKQRIPSSCLTH